MTIAGLLFETGVALLSPPLHLICFYKVRVSNLSTHNSDAIKILQCRVLCKKTKQSHESNVAQSPSLEAICYFVLEKVPLKSDFISEQD